MTSSFAHLHVHTEYSMLDGAAKVKKLLAKAVELGQPAVASTDHGNVFSHYEMWKTAKKMREDGQDIKVILGVEAYVAPATRFDKRRILWGTAGSKNRKGGDDTKDVSGNGSYTHMTLLAGNGLGLNALFELTSRASLEGQYPVGKPRIDADLTAEVLAKYPGAMLIGTTGCPSGAVQTRIRLGQYDQAVAEAAKWQEILGKENYFLELMDHGFALERKPKADLLRLAKDLGIPLLATNDSHYVEQSQAKMHDALLCIQMGTKIADDDRMKFDGEGYYLKSAEEMRDLFAELPEACDNTLAISERVMADAYDSVLGYQDDLLPQFPVPEGHTEETYLRELVYLGLREKYPDPESEKGYTAEADERAEYELGTIIKQGYPGYMLMVWDFVAWAKRSGIRVGPGRGSAAGSLVSYSLGITDVDTLLHNLLFERFINPERVSPPDVDVDFEKDKRDLVFRYLAERWGEGNVCRIQTLNTIKAKAAIKDAARVLDVPFAVGARMTAAFPKAISGFDAPLACVTDKEHERYADAEDFRNVLLKDEQAQEVFDLAVQLEGLVRSTGVHACGFVVSRYPLLGRIPIVWNEKDQQVISGFPNAEALEPMGYLKVDCLGLDTMDVIQKTVDDIRDRHGVDVEEALMALDDPSAYAQLASGNTVGMFQVASGGMAKLLSLMHADRFQDISAALALYRPGPMGAKAHTDYALRKTGRQRVSFIHPELTDALTPILGDTYGVIVYQEQVMRAVQALAGYNLGRADLLRKAMGKKKPEVLAKEKVPFRKGMLDHGYSEAALEALWDIFLPFSAYAFNVAHTVSYGHITYATAYLKAHYPAEFMAALLTYAGDDKDKKALYLGECRRMGMKVLVPDVNESGVDFTPAASGIRFGLNAIAGIGPLPAQAVVTGRADGPYTSFADFLDRVPVEACTKPTVEALIKAGAFDSLGHTRRSLISIYEDAVGMSAQVKKKESIGVFDLFGAMEEVEFEPIKIPDLEEWEEDEKLRLERETLSFYVSGHPLNRHARVLAGNRSIGIAELVMSEMTEGTVTIAGMLTSVEKKIAKSSGNPYAKLVVSDLDAQTEVMVFGQAFGVYQEKLVRDKIVVIKARLNMRDGDERTTIIADVIEDPDMERTAEVKPQQYKDGIVIALNDIDCTQQLMLDLKTVILDHPGTRQALIRLYSGDRHQLLVLPGFKVSGSRDFLSEVKGLPGVRAVG